MPLSGTKVGVLFGLVGAAVDAVAVELPESRCSFELLFVLLLSSHASPHSSPEISESESLSDSDVDLPFSLRLTIWSARLAARASCMALKLLWDWVLNWLC